ncbi:Cytochrome P450 monooxygenase eqxH [Colletotrichum spinosum]|uniref:Cytochrome P450 monooxygenase eqxH n=1 Tax=Colletotrichum spinosum TaxID=1347390 RepID=A0A4R8QEA6_9PEZI|nr:Cytochrome P450 monooxygenase eqxH [Colletotrichum spinosum]
MKTYLGDAIILPSSMLSEVRSLTELDFWPAIEKDHHGHLPGFEPFRANHEGGNMINRHLTKALNKYTKPLYQETKHAVSDILTESTVQVLRQFPPILRPLANRYLSICKQTRAALKACRDFIRPHVDARNASKARAAAKGEPEPVYDDAIEWCQREYAADRDPADSQISLAMVAIHPTTDQLTETMTQIARHPELFQPLRDEIATVLGADGIHKTNLQNLRLLDSVIKESQRLKPVSVSNFRRVAVQDFTLSNGLRIHKGDNVWIDVAHMWDSQVWDKAEQFDPYRFVKLRGTEKDHISHLVSTSPEHTGFGHGRQACPGR